MEPVSGAVGRWFSRHSVLHRLSSCSDPNFNTGVWRSAHLSPRYHCNYSHTGFALVCFGFASHRFNYIMNFRSK